MANERMLPALPRQRAAAVALACLLVVLLLVCPGCRDWSHDAAAALESDWAPPTDFKLNSSSAIQVRVPTFPSRGHWVRVDDDAFASSIAPAIDRYLAGCALVDVKMAHTCPHYTTKRAMHWRWEGPDTLGAAGVTAADVVRECLSGQAIGFVGDSMTVQTLQALLCTLASEPGLVVRKARATEHLDSWSVTVSGSAVAPLLIYQAVPYLTTVIPLRLGRPVANIAGMFHVEVNFTGLAKPVEQLLRVRDLSFLSINTGAWLTTSAVYDVAVPQRERVAVGKLTQAYRDEMHRRVLNVTTSQLVQRFAERAAQGWRNPTILYRNMAVHHSLRTNKTNPKYGGFQEPCPETTPDPDFHADAYISGITYKRWSDAARAMFGEAGLDAVLLDVELMSQERRDAHPYQVSAIKNDCRHYCLPGVPDAWNDAMLRLIWDRCRGGADGS